MDHRGPLTPREAEAVVDELIERFGPGSMPRVDVVATDDARWRVRWEHMDLVVVPMDPDAWRAWLDENVASLDAGGLETTES